MKTKILTSAIITSAALTLSARAVTTFTGDGVDTPFTALQSGAAPGPALSTGTGNPGNSLRLTDTVNGQSNQVGFDLTDPGSFQTVNFAFDFKISINLTPSADGFSFNLLDTATHGVTGGGPNLGEDPSAAGVLGFGFDTWANGAPNDDPAQGQQSNYEEISLFYNGALIQRVDDTRLLPTPLTLDDGAFHRVTGSVNFNGGTASLNVDGQAILSNVAVAGLTPFESRVHFGGRTGGENERVDLDNLNVQFVPEPTTAVLGALGLTLLLRRRRS